MQVATANVYDPLDPRGVFIICRGLPASGKSTFAERWVEADWSRRSRVNRDTIRKAYFNAFWDESIDELAVAEIALAIVTRLAEAGRDLIVDDTNLHPDRVDRLLRIGRDAGYQVWVYDFDAPLEDLIRRDRFRDKPVGADVITNMREQLFPGGQFPALELLPTA